MGRLTRGLIPVAICFALFSPTRLFSPAHAQQAAESIKWLSVDPPGAVETRLVGVNGRGEAIGFYVDARGKTHGFLRRPDGAILVIDAPGARLTAPVAINEAGEIVGSYVTGNLNYVSFGFIRRPGGALYTFNVASGVGPRGLNDFGVIVGDYFIGDPANADIRSRGFLRGPLGGTILLPTPAGCVSPCPSPQGVSNSGLVAGYYADATNRYHGFVWRRGGAIRSFDPPGSTMTLVNAVGGAGAIAGDYVFCPPAGCVTRGYLAGDMGLRTFAIAGARSTIPWAVNNRNDIVGSTMDAGFTTRGFLRTAAGALTTFVYPGAIYTAGRGVNAAGVIVGEYTDEKSRTHGFIRIPCPAPPGSPPNGQDVVAGGGGRRGV